MKKSKTSFISGATFAALLAIAPVVSHATEPAVLNVTSPAFKSKGIVPKDNIFNAFGCTGDNLSVPLDWTGAPASAKSFAVILHDPDAPTGVGFFHWIMFNIPGNTHSLVKGAGNAGSKSAPAGSVLGHTDFGGPGYGGPCPPPGAPHRYVFEVYALDVPKLDLPPTTTAAMLRFVMSGHTVAKGVLEGSFSR